MNALGLVLILFFVALILRGSRKTALVALFAVVCYVPENEQILVAGFHFSAVRFALLAGLVKVFSGRFHDSFKFNAIDKVLVAYGASVTVVSILREGTLAEAVFCFGKDYDMFLSYFISRCLLPTYEDVKSALYSLALLILPLSLFMVREALTTANPFTLMGLGHDIDVRHGMCRAQGSFQSSILAGVFGATMIPLFVGLYPQKKRRYVAMLGMAAGGMIALSSLSSAAILALVLVAFCLACWPLRERMRTIRWMIVAVILALQLIMKGDVWFIFGHLGHLMGGAGEYRSELIDSAIRHFGQWWLLGFKDTGQWTINHLANGTADITNQYIRDAVDGGLLALVLFLTLLTRCFSRLGRARKIARFEINPESESVVAEEWFLWCLGCALVTHVVTILSVEYFDQIKVVWFMFLATISGVTGEVLDQNATAQSDSQVEDGSLGGAVARKETMMDADLGLNNL